MKYKSSDSPFNDFKVSCHKNRNDFPFVEFCLILDFVLVQPEEKKKKRGYDMMKRRQSALAKEALESVRIESAQEQFLSGLRAEGVQTETVSLFFVQLLTC